jgi:hypothetical protein
MKKGESMAQVLIGGAQEFNALLYSPKHPSTVDFIKNQLNNFSNTLTDAGRTFLQDSSELIEKFNGSEAMRLSRVAYKKVSNLFQKDVIKPLCEVTEFQIAQLQMQRWIMAEPTVRTLYHQQRIDGYSETYVDVQPEATGDEHYDYRRVMDGIVTDLPVDGDSEAGWSHTQFIDDLKEGDRELDIDEQSDILITWANVKAIIDAGKEDPTSGFGGMM